MADVFISYSRSDGEFVGELVAALKARDKSVWLDTEGIEVGAVFPEAIRTAIEASDAFLFVITPESAASQYCEQEVEHALALNKRIVPVLRLPVADDALPEAIRVRNWIHYTPDSSAQAASERLAQALDTDLEHARAHTRWLVKALDWESHGRDKSFLLRGSELASAETWLAGVGDSADPAPTTLQLEYLLAGRRASARRQRLVAGASLTAVFVAVALAVAALISRNQAQTAAGVSRSRELAAESQTQLSVDPELSVLLGIEAVRSSPTAEAMHSLRDAIDASPIRLRLPAVGVQSGLYALNYLAYSPNGRWLAESSNHGFVEIFDARTGRVVRLIKTGPSLLGGWSPDGKALAVGTGQAALVVDPTTGATRVRIRAMSHSIGLAFSPDGSTLYGAGVTPSGWKQQEKFGLTHVRSVWVGAWRLATGKYRAFTLPLGTSAWAVTGVASLALRPEGRQLAVGALPGLAVFDTRTGQPIQVLAPPWPHDATATTTLPTGESWYSLAYSPDGSLLAGAENQEVDGQAGYGAWIRVLDARTQQVRETAVTTKVDEFAEAVAFSPDGSRIAYGLSDGAAAVYSLRLHKHLVNLPGQAGVINGLAFSPDGKEVATTTNRGDGSVWRATGNEQLLISPGADPTTTAFAALQRDRVVAILTPASGRNAGKIVVESWSRSDGRPLGPPLVVSPNPDPYLHASLSGDGRFVAVMVGTDPSTATRLEVWDITARRLIETLRLGNGGGANLDPVTALSPDDRYLVVSRRIGPRQPAVFDLTTGHALRAPIIPCSFGQTNRVAWSPDASLLAGTSPCGDLRIWNPTTGHITYSTQGLGEGVKADSFSPDGTRLILLAATGPGSVTVIDPRSGRRLLDLIGISTLVDLGFYSPDGKLIATASEDGLVRIWDAHTGALLRTIPGYATGYLQVAFGPDSSSILTLEAANAVTATNNIRVWDACTDCQNPSALLALAKARVTRQLTADEKRLYH